MELIENYVRAVGERLHPSRRADVEAELRASIYDALEARGADAGSEDHVASVLAALGAPERMASGYEPNRWYLIGPELIHVLGSLCTTTTCRSRSRGVSGLRSHPRVSRRAFYARS